MSKAITVTLPNAVHDSLERHIRTIDQNLPDGIKTSRSNYVAKSIEHALERAGVAIVSNEGKVIQYNREPIQPPIINIINRPPPL
jgi:hydrogenase maturation factor